jgi:hypothetical protein
MLIARIFIGRFFPMLLLISYSMCRLVAPTFASQPPGQSASPPNSKTTAPAASPKEVKPVVPDLSLTEFLLKQQYKVVAPKPESGNPFPTLAPRSSDAKTLAPLDARYKVLEVRPFDERWFFRNQKVFFVIVNNIILEARIKSGNRSSGIFALRGKKLVYLNGADSASKVTELFKQENRSLSDADPQMLARLFTMTVLRQGNDRVDIIQSPDEILKLDTPNPGAVNKRLREKGIERSYATKVDKDELEKCKAQIIKPQLSFDPKRGWTLKFTGMRGFTYKIRVPFALVAYEIAITPSYALKVSEQILSPKIVF